jgi:Predicted transcriptional regulator
VWRWTKDDPAFPKCFRISGAVTCWDEHEILAWIADKKAKRETEYA